MFDILAVIYVNFSQALYSAEEEDRMMILTLEADMVSIWPFSIEVIPIEIDGSSMLTTYGIWYQQYKHMLLMSAYLFSVIHIAYPFQSVYVVLHLR